MKQLVDIYRSKKKEGAYLYVSAGYELDQLPKILIQQFGKAEFSMKLLLSPNKKLASVNAKNVLEAIEKKGFYLQMPPKPELYMQRILNSKM